MISDEEEDKVASAYDDACILYTLNKYGLSRDVIECLSQVLVFGVEAIHRRLNELLSTNEMRTRRQQMQLMIDGFDSQTLDVMFDSFESLFCRRCFKYDCKHHDLPQPRPKY